jgi:hypothetical protein
LANFVAVLLSGTTLLVIVVATAVSYSLVQSGKKIDIIGEVGGVCVGEREREWWRGVCVGGGKGAKQNWKKSGA